MRKETKNIVENQDVAFLKESTGKIKGVHQTKDVIKTKQASKRQQTDQDEQESLRPNGVQSLNFSDEDNLKADVEWAENNYKEFASRKKDIHGKVNAI